MTATEIVSVGFVILLGTSPFYRICKTNHMYIQVIQTDQGDRNVAIEMYTYIDIHVLM